MTTRPDFLRHAGWFAPEYCGDTICIIGVGATGSMVAMTAARMGFMKFKIWDPDLVESHNLPNQAYETSHVGKKKVDALEDLLKRFNPEIMVEKHAEYFTKDHKAALEGPLVLTVDTMKARKEIADTFTGNPLVKTVFETRLGFDYGELNIIDNMNIDECRRFSSLLVNDEDIPEGPCNLRICTTLVQTVAASLVHSLCNMYVCEAKQSEWSYKKKTMFHFTPELKTYQF